MRKELHKDRDFGGEGDGVRCHLRNTDSLFVTYKPGVVERLIERIERELGFEVKLEKVYRKVFFTEAKKRYVGLTEDGKVDIVGFEAVRGDWSELAKETQLKVAELVLNTGGVDEAIKYVRGVIEDLKAGRIPLEKLVIWKTLTKRPEEYGAEDAHVTAAMIMESMGYKLGSVVSRLFAPLELNDWQEAVMGLSLIEGSLAKELIVGVIGVATGSPDPTAAVAALGLSKAQSVALLLFTMMYIPCIGTLASVLSESWSRKFTAALAVYMAVLAAIAAYVT